MDRIYNEDCLESLKRMGDKSIDLIITDPPYGIKFMSKSWDKALPDKRVWEECLRVLKDGAFAFVMSIPRADCLSRMIISLEEAGFNIGFTPIFWAQAQGFPKAQNIGKAVDKRLGAKRKIVGKNTSAQDLERGYEYKGNAKGSGYQQEKYWGFGIDVTKPATPQAKALDGSYGGFQPKPAVEVIIVAMKPLNEKTYCDQALKNRKGITWLDDGRIPYDSNAEFDKLSNNRMANRTIRAGAVAKGYGMKPQGLIGSEQHPAGRFPANLLCSDDVLNDGKIIKNGGTSIGQGSKDFSGATSYKLGGITTVNYPDSGSFSRYFDLDKWFEERIKLLPKSVQKTFPFAVICKASKSEKNKGCEDLPEQMMPYSGGLEGASIPLKGSPPPRYKNNHPTVKPLKLMSYLITLGSREGDLVLDPFIGSGTTALACINLKRHYIGCEIDKGYYDIAMSRIKYTQKAML